MKTIIHVNQHKIRKNIRLDHPEPVLTIKTYMSNEYAFSVDIDGPSRVIYSPDKPLPCGARVWIETNGNVTTNKVRE